MLINRLRNLLHRYPPNPAPGQRWQSQLSNRQMMVTSVDHGHVLVVHETSLGRFNMNPISYCSSNAQWRRMLKFEKRVLISGVRNEV